MEFIRAKLPNLTNKEISAFGSDGAAVMVGSQAGVASLMKNEVG